MVDREMENRLSPSTLRKVFSHFNNLLILEYLQSQ